MDPKIADLLDNIPENPPRSKLEPHGDIIAALRKKRYTYRQISQFFHDHLQIDAAPSTIHDFLRVRRSRGKIARAAIVEARPKATRATAPETRPAGTADDLQKRIAALKHRSPKEGDSKPRFAYDEAEPLRLPDPASTNKNKQKN